MWNIFLNLVLWSLYFRSFYFQEFVFQEFVFSVVCLSGVCIFRSLSFRSLYFRSLSWHRVMPGYCTLNIFQVVDGDTQKSKQLWKIVIKYFQSVTTPSPLVLPHKLTYTFYKNLLIINKYAVRSRYSWWPIKLIKV